MSQGPSGIGFVGCDVARAAPAEGAGGSAAHAHRREVVVNGTRIKTVDVHAHCAVPDAMAVIDQHSAAPKLLMTDTATRVAAMSQP